MWESIRLVKVCGRSPIGTAGSHWEILVDGSDGAGVLSGGLSLVHCFYFALDDLANRVCYLCQFSGLVETVFSLFGGGHIKMKSYVVAAISEFKYDLSRFVVLITTP